MVEVCLLACTHVCVNPPIWGEGETEVMWGQKEELEPCVFCHYLGVTGHNVETTDPDYIFMFILSIKLLIFKCVNIIIA